MIALFKSPHVQFIFSPSKIEIRRGIAWRPIQAGLFAKKKKKTNREAVLLGSCLERLLSVRA